MRKIIYVLILITVSVSINAQKDTPFDKKHIKPKETYKAVKDSLNDGEVHFSLKLYKQALLNYKYPQEINPNNSNLNFKIGICYLNGAHKDRARPYFEKAYELENKINDDIFFYLGRSYQFEGNWTEALNYYSKYGKKKHADETKEYIIQCNRAIELSKNPVKVKIQNIGSGVNTQYSEYSAIISADHSVMYYTGRYPTTTGKGFDGPLNDWMEDIYKSEFIDEQWIEGVNVGSPVNTNSHDAMVSLAADGQTLFIYRSENNNGGDLYMCELDGEEWSYPRSLGNRINTKHHETSVTLSADEKSLYFVSSKPGGEGGSDIYTAELNENGDWDNIQNIGNIINTDKNEESIFIHPDGKTLFFSSEGHETIGGYDVFVTTLENGEWTKPKNIGLPINTADDDVFFVLDASGKNGYYTSGKIGGKGETDIYLLEFEVEKNIALLKGTVLDEENNPIGTDIMIYDESTNELINTINSNSATGEYLITLDIDKNYRIELKHGDYPDIKETVKVPFKQGYQEIIKDFVFQKEPVVVETPDTTETIEVITVPKPGYVYTLQYFATIELNKANNTKSQLDKLGIPGVYIQKVIFTDTDEINYRVRSGRYDTLEEAKLDGDKIDQSRLPEKAFWIDNVREEDYSVKKMEYDILE